MTEIRPGVFVGREAEIAVCREVLSQVIHGRGRALLIDGEPGIGKSALLGVLLRMARRCGCTVLLSRADDITQQFPMRVMLDCLGGDPASADPRRAELAASASDSVPGEPPRKLVATLLERAVALVADLCAESPVVLAIDDLHWADEHSLLAWRQLSERAPDLPLVVVGTCCPVPHRTELSTLKQELAAAGQAVTSLGPLAPDEVTDLVAILAGGEPTGRLKRLTGRAGGNPLYVTELVEAMARGERLHVTGGVADIVTGQQPQALAAAITDRLNFLSPQTNRVLRFAALLGRDFAAAEVAAVAGLAPEQLAPALAEARTARVIAEADDRLSFRHLLIRQALYDSLPSALRVALHRQAARALAEAGAADGRVAGQLLATTRMATNPWVREWLAGAGPRLVQQVPQMAAELFRRAMADTSPGDPDRDRLEGALAAALLRLNRHPEAVDIARPLLARTVDAYQRAETIGVLGHALLGCGRHSEALQLVDDALAESALSPVWRARLRAVAALIHAQAGRLHDADVIARAALAEGEHAGDAFAVSYALHILSLVRARRPDNTAAWELTTRALATLGDEPGSADLRCALLVSRMLASQQLGRMAEAGADLRAAQDLTSQGEAPVPLALAAAEYYMRIGRWDDALDQLGSITGTPVLTGYPAPGRGDRLKHGISALIAGHRDERATAATYLNLAENASRASSGAPPADDTAYLTLAQALAAERDGRPREALAVLRPALGTSDTASPRLRSLCLPTLVRLALECDDAELAATAADASEQAARQEPTRIKRAGAEHCRGLVARDPGRLLAAARIYQDIGVPLEHGQAAEDAAASLAAAQQSAQARRALNEAADTYATLGAEWDIRRADTRLRRDGIRRGRGRSGNSTALTPTEAKIAQLISLGRSTPDIARDLLLSPRTVQTHVSHILRKLDGRSRVDIVRASLAAGTMTEDPGPDRNTAAPGDLRY
jgi:DNA-binding CsgD family transcriptional regulator/tetratricopeptide (TPR) repeat protein